MNIEFSLMRKRDMKKSQIAVHSSEIARLNEELIEGAKREDAPSMFWTSKRIDLHEKMINQLSQGIVEIDELLGELHQIAIGEQSSRKHPTEMDFEEFVDNATTTLRSLSDLDEFKAAIGNILCFAQENKIFGWRDKMEQEAGRICRESCGSETYNLHHSTH